jgi:atypical dual specificity phosphatase
MQHAAATEDDVLRLGMILRALGLVVDRGDWIEDGTLLACAYPRKAGLEALSRHGVRVIVNLHERAHGPSRLNPYGMAEVHLPVRDFTAPTPEQLAQGVAEIGHAIQAGKTVAVHCGGGLGRTGTLLACYLVSQGMTTVDAIAQVRRLRPGSIETRQQLDAVLVYGQRRSP